MNAARPPKNRRRGMALILVVTVVVVLASLALHFHEVAANRLRLGRTYLDRYRARQIARSGVLWAETCLQLDDRPYHALPADLRRSQGRTEEDGTDAERLFALFERSESQPLSFGEGRLSVEIRDEDSKVNLNRTDAYSRQFLYNLMEILQIRKRKVLEITGETVEENRNAEMTAALVDWVDRDDALSPGGAEEAVYSDMKPPYRPRNSFLQDPWELLLVRDFDPEILTGRRAPSAELGPSQDAPVPPVPEFLSEDAMTPRSMTGGLLAHTTIFGTSYRVNFNTADDEVLRAVPGLFATGQREAILARIRESRPFKSMNELMQVVNAGQADVWRHMQLYTKVTSQYFRIRATGMLGRVRVTIEALIKKLGKRTEILRWRQI